VRAWVFASVVVFAACELNPFEPNPGPTHTWDGCLAPWPDAPLGSAPVSLDIDGNGHMDVATITEEGIAWGMNLQRPRPVVRVNPLPGVLRLQAGDLDGDGLGDLVARTPDMDLYAVYGTSHGLGEPRSLDLKAAPEEFRLADIDGDGRDDLVEGTNLVSYRLQLEDGSFSDRIEIQSMLGDLAVGDFDEDGYDDVMVARVTHVSVFWGDPDAPLSDRDDLLYPDAHINLLEVMDLNGDGHLDVVHGATYDSPYVHDRAFVYGDGARGFSDRFAPLPYTQYTLGDMNGDGHLDAVATDATDEVRYGQLDEDDHLVFTDPVTYKWVGILGRFEPREYRLDDWTGDGKADIAGIWDIDLPDDQTVFDPTEGEPFTFLASCPAGNEHPGG
jgi:hypothetical protein